MVASADIGSQQGAPKKPRKVLNNFIRIKLLLLLLIVYSFLQNNPKKIMPRKRGALDTIDCILTG